mgnify:CR=1 FL=1
MGEDRRRNYMVWEQPDETNRAAWENLNVELISASVLPFLRQLERDANVPVIGSEYQPGEIVLKPPYKCLEYFKTSDWDIFCGRNVEAPLLHRLALSYPSLVLFGQSGVGKTSLLKGFVSNRTKKKFSAYLVRGADGKVGFEFEQRKPKTTKAAPKVAGKPAAEAKLAKATKVIAGETAKPKTTAKKPAAKKAK